MSNKHIVDIPKFLEIFDETKTHRKTIRISRDYLHRMLTALKSDMTQNEVIILRARIDGVTFSAIADEIIGPNGEKYTRQRIDQLEKEAILKITKLQGEKEKMIAGVAENHHKLNALYNSPTKAGFDILDGPTSEDLKDIEENGV